MKIKALFLVLLMAFICRSAYTITQEEIDNADYGTPITQAEAETGAIKFLHDYLKDPQSAICEWNQVYKGVEYDVAFFGGKGKPWFGYILKGKVNAKNSYGGYTGAYPFIFVFNNGVITRAYTDDKKSTHMNIK
jgi:hypothetical protein